MAEGSVVSLFNSTHRCSGANVGENRFQLDIPEHLRISRTRNIAEFKRDQVDNSRPQDPPPPIDVTKDGQAVYEIDRIVGWREHNGTAEFEVKWTEQDHSENT